MSNLNVNIEFLNIRLSYSNSSSTFRTKYLAWMINVCKKTNLGRNTDFGFPKALISKPHLNLSAFN